MGKWYLHSQSAAAPTMLSSIRKSSCKVWMRHCLIMIKLTFAYLIMLYRGLTLSLYPCSALKTLNAETRRGNKIPRIQNLPVYFLTLKTFLVFASFITCFKSEFCSMSLILLFDAYFLSFLIGIAKTTRFSWMWVCCNAVYVWYNFWWGHVRVFYQGILLSWFFIYIIGLRN